MFTNSSFELPNAGYPLPATKFSSNLKITKKQTTFWKCQNFLYLISVLIQEFIIHNMLYILIQNTAS